MNTLIYKIKHIALKSILLTLPLGGVAGGLLCSCSSFFDVDSDYSIDADSHSLNNANDTIYSVMGIINKLQNIADRTVLLGEARGDLVTVTENASSDLRDVALFNAGTDNKYNSPKDYYAIINNCNYFIAKADTALKNNRNQYIFRSEYAVVKAFRAWTYLQLVTTYGKVPFFTEPILTVEQQANINSYPKKDIKAVCNYFINEDGLLNLVNVETPNYGTIYSLPSKNFYIPIYLILGDLNLWAGNYWQAAQMYYKYISTRNGDNSRYPTTTAGCSWTSTDFFFSNNSIGLNDASTLSDNEVISLIPMAKTESDGVASTLVDIFNTSSDNSYKASLVPSEALKELSESQTYLYYAHSVSGDITSAMDSLAAPRNISNNMTGDLRLSNWWYNDDDVDPDGNKYTSQSIKKYNSSNVRTYRRTLVYTRLAEAINRAGYPHIAFAILNTGINNEVLDTICHNHYQADSAKICSTLNFPTVYYPIYDPYLVQYNYTPMMGLHSRGSGYTPMNTDYTMPTGTLEEMQEQVEDKIMDEEALEFAFEGYRYYDLLRVALRRDDNTYLSKKLQKRNGSADSGITVDLTNEDNWYLKLPGDDTADPVGWDKIK